jgi:hypothetical protein
LRYESGPFPSPVTLRLSPRAALLPRRAGVLFKPEHGIFALVCAC